MTTSFIYSYFNVTFKMNEIEEIVRDRIVIELERLKRELEKRSEKIENKK